MNTSVAALRGTSAPFASFCCLLLACGLLSCGTARTLDIRSEPSGARVLINGEDRGTTPLETQVTWSENEDSKNHSHTIVVRAENCADWSRTISHAEAAAARERWRIDARLERLVHTLEVVIDTEPPGATVRLDSGRVLSTPARVPVTFRRESPEQPWSVPRATISMGEDYASRLLELDYEEVRQNRHVLVSMPRIRQRVLVDITSNVEGATIMVDGREVGKTPLKHHFTFVRRTQSEPWNTFIVSAHKEHYRHRRPDGGEGPYDISQFSQSIGLHHVETGALHIDLEPIEFYRTPLYRFAVGHEGVDLEMRIEGSQVHEVEQEPAVRSITQIPLPGMRGAFAETRMAIMPDNRTIICSIPLHNPDDSGKTTANLWMHRSHEVTRLTDGYQLDLEATVSPDGQWVYFSSDRLRPSRFNLWRIRTTGRGGLTKITDSASSVADTEPAVSPDGERIAYTTYLEGSKQPQIWLAAVDGNLPTQLRAGRHPAWSPDGQKIAYIAPDVTGAEQIWVMNADGSSPTQLTSGRYEHQHPTWTPDGYRIVYASNQAVNNRGVHKFDIWMMNVDGSQKTQLTVHGSYDNRPVVSPDGKYVYFLSNRGARRDLDEGALQIWRLELEPE